MEKEILKSILDYLELKKVFHYRQNSGAIVTENRFLRFGAKGAPDIVCVIDGYYVGLEVKDIKGKQSDGQKDFQARLESAGGYYFVVKSIDDTIRALEMIPK